MAVGHAATVTNNLSCVKTGDGRLRQDICHGILPGMELDQKPFGDIAARVRWHRDLLGMTQKEYAEKIGQKRATLNNWESGDYRLSLDGALALRKAYGLSLDFMYEGIADALPMTLRNAWLDKP
jgi:DNA-binding XRE family transcriptional regulator